MADQANAWTIDAPKITDEKVLADLKKIVEIEAPLIIEHKFYRGARAPFYFIVDDYYELLDYLKHQSREGDKFTVWHLGKCCRDDNFLVCAKFPDSDGKVPLGGPY